MCPAKAKEPAKMIQSPFEIENPSFTQRKYIPTTAKITPHQTFFPAFHPKASPKSGTIRI